MMTNTQIETFLKESIARSMLYVHDEERHPNNRWSVDGAKLKSFVELLLIMLKEPE